MSYFQHLRGKYYGRRSTLKVRLFDWWEAEGDDGVGKHNANNLAKFLVSHDSSGAREFWYITNLSGYIVSWADITSGNSFGLASISRFPDYSGWPVIGVRIDGYFKNGGVRNQSWDQNFAAHINNSSRDIMPCRLNAWGVLAMSYDSSTNKVSFWWHDGTMETYTSEELTTLALPTGPSMFAEQDNQDVSACMRWDRPLTDDDIVALYNNGNFLTYSQL